MSNSVEELIVQSVLDDFAASHQSREDLEAEALFRLLSYCPSPDLEFKVRPFAPKPLSIEVGSRERRCRKSVDRRLEEPVGFPARFGRPLCRCPADAP